MPSREEGKTREINVWGRLDFEKVRQRIHQITTKLEYVKDKYEPSQKGSNPYDPQSQQDDDKGAKG